MITCPNCNHQNPDGAVQCEACYTPLPSKMACPSCGATIQSDASFCGQCGADLRTVSATNSAPENPVPVPASPSAAAPPPPLPVPPPPSLLAPDELEASGVDAGPLPPVPSAEGPEANALPELVPPDPLVAPEPIPPPPPLPAAFDTPDTAAPAVTPEATPSPPPAAAGYSAPPVATPQTRLQRNTARLLHVQTATVLELPDNVSPIRIGKPNDRVPPDIDVSGFPESEIVSRVHANIRVEGDIYYIEDVGSSNGTYVNNMPLPYGNRHRLRPGDRIALGKGDKVSFIFQLS